MAFPIYHMLLLRDRVDNDHCFKHKILKNKPYVKKYWRGLSEEGKKQYWK